MEQFWSRPWSTPNAHDCHRTKLNAYLTKRLCATARKRKPGVVMLASVLNSVHAVKPSWSWMNS
jgi:hypothetical protein